MLTAVTDKIVLKVQYHKCNNNKTISCSQSCLKKKKEFHELGKLIRAEKRATDVSQRGQSFSTCRLPNTVASPSILRPRNFTKTKATWKLERNKESVCFGILPRKGERWAVREKGRKMIKRKRWDRMERRGMSVSRPERTISSSSHRNLSAKDR